MNSIRILTQWLSIRSSSFSRESAVNSNGIQCDCSGLINLLFEQLEIPTPYQISRPKAVHYFSVLQEIGNNQIDNLKEGHLLAWRKEQLPKSGDTGHVLVVAGNPIQLSPHCYQLPVVDSTKKQNGLSHRDIEIHTDAQGKIIGLRLHLDEKKIKRTAIYHQSITESRFCFGCGLPKKSCNCGSITPILDIPPIIILRHPKERKRTLSTVSLIKQRYPNVLVKEGEKFSPLRLPNLALLFPSDGSNNSLTSFENSSEGKTLILVDATWRKAKKILHLNPWLQDLPKFSLKPEGLSNYLIRKVSNPEELSSVEIFAEMISDKKLKELFTVFIENQITTMGKTTYKKNYRHYINYQNKK